MFGEKKVLLNYYLKMFLSLMHTIGSLLKETDVGKKQGKSDLLSSAPNINDVILRRRFENLRRTDQLFNADSDDDSDDDDNDNNGLSPPPSPPNLGFLRPTAPPMSPSILSPQRLVPTAPPLDENVVPNFQKEENEAVVPDDPLLQYFEGINGVLDENYRLQKENDRLQLERFNREHSLDKLADKLDAGIDSGDVLELLEFYFSGQNERFFSVVRMLAPNPANLNFIDFLASDFGSRLMRENRLSIHIETGDLYYKDLNTGESIYSFILSQQDE